LGSEELEKRVSAKRNNAIDQNISMIKQLKRASLTKEARGEKEKGVRSRGAEAPPLLSS
jgi:hypothetical protein